MSVVRWAGISSQFVPTDIIFEKSVKKSTSFQNEKDRTRKTKRQKDKKEKVYLSGPPGLGAVFAAEVFSTDAPSVGRTGRFRRRGGRLETTTPPPRGGARGRWLREGDEEEMTTKRGEEGMGRREVTLEVKKKVKKECAEERGQREGDNERGDNERGE